MKPTPLELLRKSAADELLAEIAPENMETAPSAGEMMSFLAKSPESRTAEEIAKYGEMESTIRSIVDDAAAEVTGVLTETAPSPMVKALTIDVAVFRCYGRSVTETVEKRYHAAVAQMERYNQRFFKNEAADMEFHNSESERFAW